LDAAAAGLRRVQPGIRTATLGPWSKDVADRYLTAPFTVVPAATGYSHLRNDYQRPLLVLIAIVGLVLLIGCLNIANLSLARAISRRRELSMRLALGASRARLTRQLLAESLTLAAAGASLGLVIAAYGGRFLVTQLSTPTNPVSLDVSLDSPVLGFALAVTVLAALLFGTAPALRAARVVPMDALRAQGRATEERRPGLMAWLVVAQVAFSVVLVVAAGVFIRSFVSLANRDLGLNAHPVTVVTVDSQGTTVEPSNRVSLYERTRAAVLGLPNVADAAISLQTPASSGGFTPAVEIVDAAGARPSRRLVPANVEVFGNLVSAGWFRTFGTPITAGRDFTDGDRRGAPPVAVINETFVRRFFATQSPLGHTIVVYPNTPRAMPAQIVGIAADAIYGSPRDAVPPTWYMPIAQFDRAGLPFASVRLSVRANAGSPELLTKSVAAAIGEVDPQLALTFRPLASQIHAALTRERLMAQLAASLGVLALILAGLGLYGVTAYAISRRRTEIAVRMALGALPGRVITLVLVRVWLQVGLGIVAGTGISLWASRFVGGLIHGLSPHEPATLVGAAVLLCAMGTAAAWLPARRAARMDPVAVLREN
jgi:predicted permease